MSLRALYTLIFRLAMPAILARLWWRGRVAPAYRQRVAERFGLGDKLPPGSTLWLHAVSVGEFIAAVPLIRRLQQSYPDHQLLITTTTPTGAERVRATFGDQVFHRYLPYDLPGAMARFIDRTQPALAVMMETEIWPNLYHACRRRHIPLVLVNARMSARSARGYARLASLSRDTLRCLSAVAAQSEADRERLIALGAFAERVEVTGSIKFDLELASDLQDRAVVLRESLGAGRPVWIAASTHDGEDEIVLDAFAKLREQVPTALLVLVPRHPERFDAVAELCLRRQLSVVRRSEGAGCVADTQVFLGDTMGELMVFYAAADVAFVGGSLVATGGHNPLEPAALGLPVLMGPHTFNFAEITRWLAQAGGLQTVQDASSLAQAVTQLLQNEHNRQVMGEAARTLVAQNRGALARVMTLLARQRPNSSS